MKERMKRLGAKGYYLLHNHPSGDPTPSPADIEMTRTIDHIAKSLGIVLHDHLIIARNGHLSLRENGDF